MEVGPNRDHDNCGVQLGILRLFTKRRNRSDSSRMIKPETVNCFSLSPCFENRLDVLSYMNMSTTFTKMEDGAANTTAKHNKTAVTRKLNLAELIQSALQIE